MSTAMIMKAIPDAPALDFTLIKTAHKPVRLGFLGTGWIGRLRMQSLLDAQAALELPLVQYCAVCDPSPEAAAAAAELTDDTRICTTLDDLLDQDLDGVVIATPSALHADQCVEVLESGKAVFCQKPLARTSSETARVIQSAWLANRLLAVDFSYRHLQGMETLRKLVADGELGEVFAIDLTFHNAYGPDKPWFYDMASSGGGCVMDLGIHLVDLAMWVMNSGDVSHLSSSLYHQGKRQRPPYKMVEDYATAEFGLGEARVRLNCSWNLHAGKDAVIEAHFYGTKGGVVLRNINGSFFDFELEQTRGTSRKRIAGYPDAWGGRALLDWVMRLRENNQYDPTVEQALKVAHVIDRIYCR
jgi:Predicted dehydrogenases and related proteins